MTWPLAARTILQEYPDEPVRRPGAVVSQRRRRDRDGQDRPFVRSEYAAEVPAARRNGRAGPTQGDAAQERPFADEQVWRGLVRAGNGGGRLIGPMVVAVPCRLRHQAHFKHRGIDDHARRTADISTQCHRTGPPGIDDRNRHHAIGRFACRTGHRRCIGCPHVQGSALRGAAIHGADGLERDPVPVVEPGNHKAAGVGVIGRPHAVATGRDRAGWAGQVAILPGAARPL